MPLMKRGVKNARMLATTTISELTALNIYW
jgi:hypothetical protein